MLNWRKKGQDGGIAASSSALVASLDIPVPFAIEDLCASIAVRRGRPIHIHGMEHTGTPNRAPCGAWISLDHSDHIFVENATSPLHRAHIILHELCHMLLGHSCLPTDEHEPPALDDGRRRALAEVLSVEEWAGFPLNRIISLLGRTGYTHADEKAAEGLAGLIARRIRDVEEATRHPADPLANHLINALIE
ncbi:hypothetical protein [Kitasatospora nipponensis]